LTFPAEKSDSTCRIFILGESAAQGDPDMAFNFGRILRKILRQQYPGVDFEVINTGIAAINSHVVVEIAKGCARCRPDFFIVYMGNNEVVGPYGPGTILSRFLPSLTVIRCAIALKTTRLGQLLTFVSESLPLRRTEPQTWHGMEMFSSKQVRADDVRMPKVYEHFQTNLEEICRIGRKSGAKVILCTVGCNLKDSPPFASLHRPDLSRDKKAEWDEIYQKGIEYEDANNLGQAIETYLAAAQIDDSYAELQFRLGRCYLALQQYDKAKERYLQARRLDTLRFRPDEQINDIIRAAAGKADQGVFLVDSAKLFEQNSDHSIAGEELFWEHVHLNLAGNYLLARAAFEQIDRTLSGRIRTNRAIDLPLLTLDDCIQQLPYTGVDQYKISRRVLNEFFTRPPFNKQIYQEQRVRKFRQTLDTLSVNMTHQGLQSAAEQYRRTVLQDPNDSWLHWKYAELLVEDLNDCPNAIREFLVLEKFLPYSYGVALRMANTFTLAGQPEEAIKSSRKAIQFNPACGRAYYYLAAGYQTQTKFNQAIKFYYNAIQLEPTYIPSYIGLGNLLFIRGQLDKAEDAYRRGITVEPEDPVLHYDLALLLAKQGKNSKAVEELHSVLRKDPNFPDARQALEFLSSKQN